MIVVRSLLGIDAVVAAVVIYFFIVGVGDGSVSSFNGGLWAAILVTIAGVIGGGWALEAKGYRPAAIAVLLVLAIPCLLYALFLALILITNPRMN